MSGVLYHRPYDVTDRLTAHHRTGRQRRSKILRAARPDELHRVRVRCFEHLASGGKGRDIRKVLRVFLEIEIKTFRSGCAFDKPVESLCRVSNLLRRRHHALLWAEFRMGLIKDPG